MTQYLQNSLSSKKEEIHTILSENELTNETDRIVLNALSEIQPTTRTELCKKTGIPRTTIYDALNRLILKKVVIKFSTPRKTKGRPKVFYRIA
ncbi:MAG: helix-turn-helix domain-containing protein [Candidatus Thorarchaeota archaeon]